MVRVKLCLGSSCFARGNGEMLDFLEQYIKSHALNATLELSGCRCTNCCSGGPNLFINDKKYSNVSTEQVVQLIENACAEE